MCVGSGDLARINNERGEKENKCLIKVDLTRQLATHFIHYAEKNV